MVHRLGLALSVATINQFWRTIMHVAKQEALETIDKPPEDTEIIYQLYPALCAG